MPKKEVYVLAYTSKDEAGNDLYWCDVAGDPETHMRHRAYVEGHPEFTVLFESLQDVEEKDPEGEDE